MRLGLRSQSQSCEECLVAFSEGGSGSSFFLWEGSQAYGLLKVGIQSNRNNQGTLYLLPEAGLYIEILKNFKLSASYQYEKFINGMHSGFDIWTLKARLGSSKWWDFRIHYQKRDDIQIVAGLRLYL